MRCIALATTTGKRCGREAEPGSLFCDVYTHNADGEIAPGLDHLLQEEGHQEGQDGRRPPLRELPRPVPGSDLGPAAGPGPDTTPSDAPGAEISREADPEPTPQEAGIPGQDLDDLPVFDGPEAEPSARMEGHGPELDPDAFREFIQTERIEAESGSGTPPDSMRPGAPRPELWSPDQAAALVCPLLDRRFSKDGKDPLSPGERKLWGDAVAKLVNEKWPELDPNNPWAALAMAAGFTVLPRYAPDAARGAVRRVRGSPPPPRPKSDDQEAETGPQEPEKERPGSVPPWGASESLEA